MNLQQWELWSLRSPISQAAVAIFPCFLGTCCGLNLAWSGLGDRCQVLGRTKHPLGILSLGPRFSVAAQIQPKLELLLGKMKLLMAKSQLGTQRGRVLPRGRCRTAEGRANFTHFRGFQ